MSKKYPHDKKFQFLLDKMDQYLSFFFFYQKPLCSVDPFHEFISTQLKPRVLEIKKNANEQDNEWIANRIKSVLRIIMHFASILQRLSIGLSNWPIDVLTQRRKFFEINYYHVTNMEKQISDSGLLSEYVKMFGDDELFKDEIDLIQKFSENELSTIMRSHQVFENLLNFNCFLIIITHYR